jgi:peptidoglycan-associated lipoprotein
MFRLGSIAIVFAFGCSASPKRTVEKPVDKNQERTVTKKRAAPDAGGVVDASPNLGVTTDLLDRCLVRLSDVAKTPKFDFDEFVLEDRDREVLDAIGRCVMKNGPLAGRALQLVGRADPRGTTEYNLALGDKRANAVSAYLVKLGLGENQIATTTRGDLDATGRDEIGWRTDRRVDLQLMEDLEVKDKVSSR